MNSTRLKEETREYHDNVERVMNSNLLFSNQFTVDHYNKIILQSYLYIKSIKPKINEHWTEYTSLLNAKQSALETDLRSLAIKPSTKEYITINNKDKYYSLGLLYIVLGAMLGNKIILKKLNEYPSFEGYSFAYLSEHQDNLSEIWKKFQEKINMLNIHQLESVIQGAKAGYSLFGK